MVHVWNELPEEVVEAGILKISLWEGKQPEVMAYIATNDISKKRDEVLQREFRELGRKLKSKTSEAIGDHWDLFQGRSKRVARERVGPTQGKKDPEEVDEVLMEYLTLVLTKEKDMDDDSTICHSGIRTWVPR
eukprot:g47097.t1